MNGAHLIGLASVVLACCSVPGIAQEPDPHGQAFDAAFEQAMAAHEKGVANATAFDAPFRMWLQLEPDVARAGGRGLAGAWCALLAGEASVALPLFRSIAVSGTVSTASPSRQPRVGELVSLIELQRDADATSAAARDDAVLATATRQVPAAVMGLADRRLRAGDEVMGLRLFRVLATEFPTHAPTWANLALAQRHLGKLRDSESTYRKALALAPRDVVIWNDFGLMLRAAGRPAEALAAFEKSFALDEVPGSGPSVTNLVDAVLRDRFASAARRDAVLERATAALEVRPEAKMLRRLTLELLRRGSQVARQGRGSTSTPASTRPRKGSDPR